MSDMNVRLMAELDVDTKKAQDKITTLASDNNAPLNSNFINNDTTIQNINEKFLTLNEMINSVIGSFKVFTDKLKDFPEHGGGGGGGGGNPLPPNPGDGHNQNPFFKNQKNFSSVLGYAGILSAGLQGQNAADIMNIRGDYRGAEISRYRTSSGALSTLGTSLMMTGVAPAMIAGGVLSALGLGGNLLASYKEKNKAEADSYLSDFDEVYNALRIGYTGKTYSTDILNNTYGEREAEKIIKNNKGLGLSNSDYLRLVSEQNKMGVADINIASKNVEDAAILALATGGNAENYASALGFMNRYSNSKDPISVNKLYSNAMQSGLSPLQFQEFLDGLSVAVERGVASGNTVAVEEIAGTLQWLGNINGNSELWKGKEGVAAYNTMSTNLSQIGNLQSTEQILAFQSLKKANPKLSNLELLKRIEGGNFNENELQTIIANIKNSYGSEEEAIFAISNLMGIDISRAMGLYYNHTKSKKSGVVELSNNQQTLGTQHIDKMNETSETQGARFTENYNKKSSLDDLELNPIVSLENVNADFKRHISGTKKAEGVEADFYNALSLLKEKEPTLFGDYLDRSRSFATEWNFDNYNPNKGEGVVYNNDLKELLNELRNYLKDNHNIIVTMSDYN